VGFKSQQNHFILSGQHVSGRKSNGLLLQIIHRKVKHLKLYTTWVTVEFIVHTSKLNLSLFCHHITLLDYSVSRGFVQRTEPQC